VSQAAERLGEPDHLALCPSGLICDVGRSLSQLLRLPGRLAQRRGGDLRGAAKLTRGTGADTLPPSPRPGAGRASSLLIFPSLSSWPTSFRAGCDPVGQRQALALEDCDQALAVPDLVIGGVLDDCLVGVEDPTLGAERVDLVLDWW